jgi:hypothetical protein
MTSSESYSVEYIINEANSLHERLHMVKPFSMTMPMVKGAFISNEALKGVTELLEKGKRQLHSAVLDFIRIAKKTNQHHDVHLLQKKFTLLKLRYNSILDQLDIFADVLSQRAEHDTGIWLSGLDTLAEDGLTIGKQYYDAPPLMVFLERGHGAAIRRARTRLPGGDENPVAVIQIPRERMVGSGIASSLIHEVGHQAAELLDLVESLRPAIEAKKQTAKNENAYLYYNRWISEIIADYWAIGQLGISSALGLTGVVTLPKYFQFRLDLHDPHPAPYVRVQISCAFGNSLYPHPQWSRLWDVWKSFYPIDGLPADKIQILKELEEELPQFVELVNNHRPKSLKGKRLADLFPLQERQPHQLQQYFQAWKANPYIIDRAPPTLIFAILGQAKSDLLLEAADESKILTKLLRLWAFNRN